MQDDIDLGPTREIASFPNYVSSDIFDLALFVGRLHSLPGIAKQEYLLVRTLRFHLPFDSMASSGILPMLGIMNPRNLKDPPPHKHLVGDLGLAAAMCRQVLEAHGKNPDAVPPRKWWQIIVWMLRRCTNVVVVEVPPEWASVTWYPPRFPRVNVNEPRRLGNARWRWTGTVEEEEEAMEEEVVGEEEEEEEEEEDGLGLGEEYGE